MINTHLIIIIIGRQEDVAMALGPTSSLLCSWKMRGHGLAQLVGMKGFQVR
uniref:Uncharacterized protein n=1 Tax=Arundo donax TaxID=35708 RepID=A0A0A8Z428_ARUDO